MANDFTLDQPFWFSAETVRTEINVLQHMTLYSQTQLLTRVAIEVAVQKYFDYVLNPTSTSSDTIDAKIQFVARIHLLHPVDYEKHQKKYQFKIIPLAQLHRTDTFISTLLENETATVKTKTTRFQYSCPELYAWLIDACIRHQDFLAKSTMYYQKYDDDQIENLMIQYYQFLRVKKENPAQLVVPSNEQDLLWHLHQLDNKKYKKEVTELAGVFLDHDDNIAQDKLDRSYKQTRILMCELQSQYEASDQESHDSHSPQSVNSAGEGQSDNCMNDTENDDSIKWQRIISYVLLGIGGIFILTTIIYAIRGVSDSKEVSKYGEELEVHYQNQDTSMFKYVDKGYCRASATQKLLNYEDEIYSVEDGEDACKNFCQNDKKCVGYAFGKKVGFVSPPRDKKTGYVFKQPTTKKPNRCIKYTYIDLRCGVDQTNEEEYNYNCMCRTDQKGKCVGLPDLCATKDHALIFGLVSIPPLLSAVIFFFTSLSCCKKNCPGVYSCLCESGSDNDRGFYGGGSSCGGGGGCGGGCGGGGCGA